jgi:hypothetical protein
VLFETMSLLDLRNARRDEVIDGVAAELVTETDGSISHGMEDEAYSLDDARWEVAEPDAE